MDVNHRSPLWGALRQRAAALQASLEHGGLAGPAVETLEGVAVVLQLAALCAVHCAQPSPDR